MHSEPFKPARGFGNPHVQTLAGSFLRGTHGVSFRRERIDTPDDDFLDLDIVDVDGSALPPQAPVALVLHGLEGSARRPYVCAIARQLAVQGVRAVGMNYRSCSGEMNRTLRFYHAGETEDVTLVHDWLDRSFPGVPKAMVGISLGANVLLKYLGERGTELGIRLRAAVAVSPPFDLARGAKQPYDRALRLYARGFLLSLKAKVKAKEALLSDHLDVARILAAETIYDFDQACTAPLNGFDDADDYYTRSSSQRYLAGVQTPTLILRALDDPLIPRDDVPYDLIQRNPALVGSITEHGGHVGWLEGPPSRPYGFWMERQVARFLALHLLRH